MISQMPVSQIQDGVRKGKIKIAVIGLGLYAAHKGALKYNNRRIEVNLDIDTCIAGYRTNTTFRIGGR